MISSKEKINFIRNSVEIDDILCQIAEEAAELAQAALKLRRAMGCSNPTPASLTECTDALTDEWADLNVCMEVFNRIPPGRFDRTREFKIFRWYDRIRKNLSEAKDEDDG